MMTKDRIILIALMISIWALIGAIWLKPSDSFAQAGHMHNSIEILGVAKENHHHQISYKDIYDFEEGVTSVVRK